MDKLPTLKPNKQELVDTILKYIRHARQIANNSDSNYYRTPSFTNAMNKLCDLVTMCQCHKNWMGKDIASFALLNKRSLAAILPYQGNVTYASTVTRLNDLVDLCNEFISTRRIQMSDLMTLQSSSENDGRAEL